MATCQTNIRCLQVISDTLDSEDSVAVVSDEDIQEVQGEAVLLKFFNLMLTINRHYWPMGIVAFLGC